MEVTHEILTPYLDAAISNLADTAAPYGLLRRYSKSGGELTGNPWHTTGLILIRPDGNHLVLEALFQNTENRYFFRVYWTEPLDIVHAFKCSVSSETFSQVVHTALDAFLVQIEKIEPCTPEEAKELTDSERLTGELKDIYEITFIPVPPPFASDDIPDGSMSPEEQEARLCVIRGGAFDLGGKARNAMREYRAALKLWPAFPKVHLQIGQLHYYARKPRYEKALAEFQETVRLAPELSTGYYWCGEALDKLGQFDEAMEAYRKAFQLEPEPWYLISQGICLYQAGRYPEAISTISRGIELKPSNEEMSARMYLADALKANDQLPEAIEQWRIVAKTHAIWDEEIAVVREAQDFLDQFAPSSFDITTL